MIGSLSGLFSAVVLISLLIFGYWFNSQVEKWGTDAEGFTWLLVVIGTLVTLAGIALLDVFLDWNAGLLGLMAFASSGFFMCLGAVRRYVDLRNRLKVMARHDTPQTLAE